MLLNQGNYKKSIRLAFDKQTTLLTSLINNQSINLFKKKKRFTLLVK